MRSPWLEIVDRLLRPARPDLEHCLRMRELHLAAWRPINEPRVREMARLEASINTARGEIFATNDGVVGAQMTGLEREWRTLSRSVSESGQMDLWARMAPASWIDRKRWQASPVSSRLDAMVALASDALNVEAAEAALQTLRPGARVRWRLLEHDAETAYFFLPESAGVSEDVLAAVSARFPERLGLARDVARAAFVDCAPLAALWKTGYVISEVTSAWVTLEIPPLA